MPTFTSIASCRICGSEDLTPILSLGEQCLTGVFPRTLTETLTRGPLELVKCSGEDKCGLVQLRHTYSSAEMYGANYGYRSSLNRTMVDHLERKVEALRRIVTLTAGDLVLDIGSNDGTTLSFYPEFVERAGIDPTASKFREYYPAGAHAISDFFSAALFDTTFGGRKAKIITSIAMLYDLEQPLEFARQIESCLSEDGIWHFEQSYLPLLLKTTGYDTICHEHVEYYALRQIEWIVRRAGMRVLHVKLNDVNGGSFAVTTCKQSAVHVADDTAARVLADEDELGLGTTAPFERFAKRVALHRDKLLGLLQGLTRDSQLVLGYGASTKGNVILQYCGIGPALIPCFAEVNPDKFGALTPGSGIPIVSEDEAKAMHPDYLLVMPWHFRANLLQREQPFIESGGRLIFPLPQIEIIASPGA